MSPRKLSRRVFLGLTAAGAGAAGASVIGVPGAAAEPTQPDPESVIDPEEVPFLQANLRERGALLAEQYGRPDIAEAFRKGCFAEIFDALRTARPENWAQAAPEFVSIFPGGPEIMRTFVLLNTLDWTNPRDDVDVQGLTTQHLSMRGLSVAPLRYVSASPAADTSGLTSFLGDLQTRWVQHSPWLLAARHGRRSAAAAAIIAAEALKVTVDRALSEAVTIVPEPLLEKLKSAFLEIASTAGWHIVFADVVDFQNACVPFLEMLPGGVIPLGVGREGSFDVIAVGQ